MVYYFNIEVIHCILNDDVTLMLLIDDDVRGYQCLLGSTLIDIYYITITR